MAAFTRYLAEAVPQLQPLQEHLPSAHLPLLQHSGATLHVHAAPPLPPHLQPQLQVPSLQHWGAQVQPGVRPPPPAQPQAACVLLQPQPDAAPLAQLQPLHEHLPSAHLPLLQHSGATLHVHAAPPLPPHLQPQLQVPSLQHWGAQVQPGVRTPPPAQPQAACARLQVHLPSHLP